MSGSDDATGAASPAAREADTIVEEDIVLASDSGLHSDHAPAVDASPRVLAVLDYGERYEVRRELGKGGMGEVNLCVDQLIGREVAVKVMLEKAAAHGAARDRFLREARVQAQLEHPGVVPVYDLGVTPSGQPYFAMKRVKGTTLQAVIMGLREEKPELMERYPQRALLSVLERVCETVAYAHARGVVHRDLKPANVMLGDFGEVSVLDWGIAKLRTDSDLTGPTTEDSDEDFTVPGSVIGTPGYMAPEQATGDEIDARADVYALGAILYELVTLERLHEGSRNERIRGTITGVDSRPGAIVEGVPSEIDAICVRATETLRDKRYPNAKEMLTDLRAFLEGQRFTELRREVAGKHVAAARLSLAGNASATETVRVRALRDLGAAIVLDPGNDEMIEMIETLLAPEGDVPEDVQLELDASRQRDASHAAGRSAVAYAAGLGVLPILMWMGVRDWAVFALMCVGIALAAFAAAVMWRSGRSTGAVAWAAVPGAFAMLGILSTLFGPFFLVPAVVVTSAVAFTVSVRAEAPLRRLIIACGCGAIVVPYGLQRLGVMAESLSFADGHLSIIPRLASFPELPTTVLLLITSLFVVIVSTSLVGRAVESLTKAERRLALQASRLRAMLPRTR